MYPIAAFTCLKKGSFCIIFAINLLYQVQNALNRIFLIASSKQDPYKPIKYESLSTLEVLTWMNVHRPNMSVIYDR